jgi:hypothetical protein
MTSGSNESFRVQLSWERPPIWRSGLKPANALPGSLSLFAFQIDHIRKAGVPRPSLLARAGAEQHRAPQSGPLMVEFADVNLREALIEATLGLIEEGSLKHLTGPAAVKRARVSSVALFRDSPNGTAFMTAVAQQATRAFGRKSSRRWITRATSPARGTPLSSVSSTGNQLERQMYRKHAQRKVKRFEASRTSRIEERPTLRSGRAWRHSCEAPMQSE